MKVFDKEIRMEYSKVEDLKVRCIADSEDFELFGITVDDLLNRSEAGFRFLRKIKELAGANQGIEWTNTAYTLQISLLPEDRVMLVFSETIEDYIVSLKNSTPMADAATIGPLKDFIRTLEESDPVTAREYIKKFEYNVREEIK